MPISPSASRSRSAATAPMPALSAATHSASLIAGPVQKSKVGCSSRSGITPRVAPAVRQSWLIAAPPASKFATICAVTALG